ncbi:Uncharacterized protein OS=Spirochaeta smaragdinae (strain DSM 11293 / JCM 15392 / SEBR 4228) GN=Spirs_3089 PE=4 SV=1: DUF2784 [Gemmata massiliana]|uniref:DUF2784 domain-containing protein n=1 Tax=Gemmata massiliana TaxID=1210884 RepID=A0A6P2D9F0_9BACT|nr:DUF2784 family protein [Gemmata massiliana]VTR96122.1 Uncharacterized protein OS=Spirochaeta smaragdinae (strain DSM 11293 / JCM 15392 / SEBR 4228) GN=Spirs_3089 PE=4 SV=1: DUF2784 [Gemmata massiliana]
MWYGLAADTVVAVHVAYVAYVVLGQVAVIVAAPFRWQWARNPWFRFSHLTAIAVVGYEEIRGLRCPLTVWEEQLRALAGQTYNVSETFMGRLMHDLLFIDGKPDIFFTTVHLAMLVLVVQALIMYPPRWFRFGRAPRVALAPAVA